MASSMNAMALATRLSKSLARRRLRLSQPMVRSTTHRRGGTVNLSTEDREGWNAAGATRQPRHR
jgi:hypothetical protein